MGMSFVSLNYRTALREERGLNVLPKLTMEPVFVLITDKIRVE